MLVWQGCPEICDCCKSVYPMVWMVLTFNGELICFECWARNELANSCKNS